MMRLALGLLIASLISTSFADTKNAAHDPKSWLASNVQYCPAEPGEGCKAQLMGWTLSEKEDPWAIGCNMGQGEFCAWCAKSSKTIRYKKGERSQPSDCSGK